MLIAGLTGGLACGKTFVAGVFGELGCHIVEADQLGRELISPGGECFEAVHAAFGETDRAKLAALVFSDPEKLGRLNAIVHPAVRRRLRQITEALALQDPFAIAIYVAAILIETGSAREFQKLIVVHCSRAQQMERAAARGWSEADILARLSSQLPAEEKAALADYVIDTSGSHEETRRQTKMVFEQLKEFAL